MIPLIYMIGAWRFGDWKHFEKYYPSILFFLSVEFGISYLTSDYRFWIFEKGLLTPNHKITEYFLAFTSFPSIVFLYLSRYPNDSSWMKRIMYVVGWIMITSLFESIFKFGRMISYHNGWNFYWSIVVWIFMFVSIRLHYSKPLWAWLLCFACTAFMILYFHIPVAKME